MIGYKNSILFVAYEFPPEGCRGTRRIMKILKYIPREGNRLTVLTVKRGNYEYHDGSLNEEIPKDVEVIRTYTLENIFHRNKYPSEAVIDARKDKNKTKNKTLVRKLTMKFYHRIGRVAKIPDSRILWLPFALYHGVKIIRKNEVTQIFASGPSFTNHIIGALLKKITGKKLLIDFRDSWVSDPARKRENLWQKKIIERQERFVIKNCSVAVTTTEGITGDLKKRYPEYRKNIFTLTHGYDVEDFPENYYIKEKETSKFTIVHSGTLGSERSPIEIFRCLSELIEERRIGQSNIQVILVGQSTRFNDGKNIDDYIETFKLGKIVKNVGFVSKNKSIEYMMLADILLLIIGKVPEEESDIYGISAKIYDYAYIGKTVLTIAQNGATSKLAKKLSLGPVVDPDDLDRIKQEIYGLYKNRNKSHLYMKNDGDNIKKYDYRLITGKLMGYLIRINTSHAKEK